MANRKAAVALAEVMVQLIVGAGGTHYTAHRCAAEWWRAIERGDFGAAPEERQP